ncbi:MAG: hypothetical protein WKF96_19460 [Solirubrobacteraceae bacterium]
MTGRERQHDAHYVSADPGEPPAADSPAARRVVLGWLQVGAEILRRRGELDDGAPELAAER